jgi:hypothetical protein
MAVILPLTTVMAAVYIFLFPISTSFPFIVNCIFVIIGIAILNQKGDPLPRQ